MDHPEGAGSERADRVEFDRRVRVEFEICAEVGDA